MKFSAQVVLGVLIAVVLPCDVFGQMKSDEPVKTVRIYGRVTDVTGAIVPSVAVVLKLAGSTEATATTKTGETGEYTFIVVPHRSYEIVFECPGFRPETKTLTPDKDTDVGKVMLSVGQGRGVMVEPMNPQVELPGSAPQGQPRGQDQTTKPTSKLWAAISVPQPIFYQDRIEDLQMSFALVNDGGSTVDPKIGSSHLLINGVEPQDWFFVIGNGPRNEWFNALPPGQTLQFTYLLGPRYFQKPGDYTVRWQADDFKAADLTLRVLPRNR
jgi:hypothetical protein